MNAMNVNATMAATNNYAAMNYQECLKMADYFTAMAEAKRQAALNSILAQMAMYGISANELNGHILNDCADSASTSETIIETPVAEENNEPIVETMEKSVFDSLALNEPYNPMAVDMENNDTSDDEDLSSMDDLLSDDTRYATKMTSIKKTKRLPSMDDLLSGDPDLFHMGYITNPKTEKYKQDKRIFDATGISPTLTTHGNSLVLI